ncbi:MAG: hypothetical protein JST51_20415 [Armatimonadetes bacterium]|nr:hypothetical protein [Armatimonadota bacterium]
MVELSVRLVLAGLMVFIAGATGVPPFIAMTKISLIQSALAVFAFTLDRKNLRLPAVSALIACADALMIQFALGSITTHPALETFGFLSLAPIILAAARHNSNPFLMTPVASAGMVLAHMANHGWHLANLNILGAACTFLLIGCLVKPFGKVSVMETEDEEETVTDDMPMVELHKLSLAESHNEELRNNYRQLKDAYRDLDRKSRKDRVAAMLADIHGTSQRSGYFSLCEKITEATGAAGVLLYTVSNVGDQFIVRGAAGEVNEVQLSESLSVNAKQAIALVREQADHLSQILEPEKPCSNVVLQHEGKVVGVLTVTARDRDQMFEALEALQPCAPLIASIVLEEQNKESMRRRLTEVEVLYAVVSNAEGATTRSEVAARIARDFQSVLQIEHLSIYSIVDDEPLLLANEGRTLNLLGSMTFANGGGTVGWLNSGSPEIVVNDARTSSLLPSEAIVRSRIGSYVVIPVNGESGPYGYITAASGRIGGIDTSDLGTLRSAAAELSRLFMKPETPEFDDEGILSPRKFIEAVGKSEGTMVTLVPLQYKEFERKYGKPAMSHALRSLTMRVRPHTPSGALMCKHPDGLIMVFLKGTDKDSASVWANDVTSKGLGNDLRTPDGSARIPLQLRVKVASLSPQLNQFLVPSAA